ncbi:unnamed protein product, partial [Laminaria digitata]
QWLKAEQWHRRLAACLVIRELARKAPSSVYHRMTETINHIVLVVHNARLIIRETAAEALTICLEMSMKRPTRLNLDWYFIVFRQLRLGLGKATELGMGRATEAQAHGSILMVSAILDHGGKFMLPRFNETCVSVMELKDHHSSPLVKESVTTLLPKLAHYDSTTFGIRYLEPTLKYLYDSCRSR